MIEEMYAEMNKRKAYRNEEGMQSNHGTRISTSNERHLLVVENGEVLGLLDIAKCLHDAIARMKRAAEKGKAIAAAIEGVEKHWGT
ncbi:hypothetical protein JHK87_006408 [Glycine soja]|nr:hypothetical protein JHK87_006408 [Glycine soja]